MASSSDSDQPAGIPMSSSNITAPTPQNTPLNHAPITSGLSRPTVAAISEDAEGEEAEAGLSGSAVAGALQSMVTSRLGSLVGASSGYVESLPDDVKRSVEALKGIQTEQDVLLNKFKWEALELERKYNALQQPLYDRRKAIITGVAAPKEEEVKKGAELFKEEDEDYKESNVEGEAGPSAIPSFWLNALRTHPGLMELITERDEEALKWLTDIRVVNLPLKDTDEEIKKLVSIPEESASSPGYSLLFYFNAAENPYFSNDVLVKTYFYQPTVDDLGDWIYDKAIGTKIDWKEEDMDLTREWEVKRQRNKSTNRTRLVRKAKPTQSFFNFFDPPLPPNADEAQTEEEAEAMEEIDERLEIDYQIGEDIKEKVVPRAIDYFTGKALAFDDYSESEDEDDYETEASDEDDDHDDDDDLPSRRRPAKKGGKGAGSNVNPEECKQQ
ncbi:NAP-domain-containing protein [Schizophyllum commune Loenen D]|nr:NAP-domain-containing protein [Schizophyllum commune Loenen D]